MKSQGYTLIELMIVLVITSILFTVGYNAFQDYSRQQALLAAVRGIQTDLRSAQESAAAGTKPANCTTLNGYQFKVVSQSSYEIDAFCTNNVIQVKVTTLPQDLIIRTPSPNPIIFKSLAQATNVAAVGSATIIITQNSSQNTRGIVVGSNGNIQ